MAQNTVNSVLLQESSGRALNTWTAQYAIAQVINHYLQREVKTVLILLRGNEAKLRTRLLRGSQSQNKNGPCLLSDIHLWASDCRTSLQSPKQVPCKGDSSSDTDAQAGQSNQTPEHVFLFIDYKGSQGWLALMWVTTLFSSNKYDSWFLCADHNIIPRHTACDSWTGSTPFAKSGISKLWNGLMNFKPSIFAHHCLYGGNIIKSLHYGAIFLQRKVSLFFCLCYREETCLW